MDAAQQVAGQVGAGKLTQDKGACECGMSKGGLLYNFPNKDALLSAMLDRLLEQHRQILATEERMLDDEPNRCLKAILRSMACHQMADPEVYLSLLAAAAQQPELLAPVRETLATHYQRLTSESTDPQLAVLLWLAAEGLLFHDILNIAPYSKTEKNTLFQRLFEISGEVS